MTIQHTRIERPEVCGDAFMIRSEAHGGTVHATVWPGPSDYLVATVERLENFETAGEAEEAAKRFNSERLAQLDPRELAAGPDHLRGDRWRAAAPPAEVA